MVAATARASPGHPQDAFSSVTPFPAADRKLLGDLIEERFGLSFKGVRQEILASRLTPRFQELHRDSPRAITTT